MITARAAAKRRPGDLINVPATHPKRADHVSARWGPVSDRIYTRDNHAARSQRVPMLAFVQVRLE
jgi:hypothetical protein